MRAARILETENRKSEIVLTGCVVKDYYALLNVKPTATLAQIDAAYRRLMQKYHPTARSSPQLLDRLRELNEAWRILSDPAQRAAYDRARQEGQLFQSSAAPPPLRATPAIANTEFSAPFVQGGSCVMRLVAALVFMFAFGIFSWGVSQRVDFGAWWKQTEQDIRAYVLQTPDADFKVAKQDATPTPDPRCRGGCETPPAGCVVKGDVEASGARFFYLPNDAGYASIQVDLVRGDRWFCAVGDAQAAGWTRKAPTETPPPPPPPEAFTTTTARKNFVVCAENAALFQGPGDDFAIAQKIESGARVTVTGVNGEWSVVNLSDGVAYIHSSWLCAPTRAAPRASVGNATASPPAQTLSPVANVADAHFKYPAPRLVEPTNGARYWCARELALAWSFDSELAPDEYFLVESKPHEQKRWTALADWTKETRVTLYPSRDGGSCDTVWWANTGAYQWRVSVVRGNKAMPEYLSPFSQVNDLIYAQ